MILLRDYQEELIDNTRALIRRGVKRIVIQGPTGMGKTALAATIISGALSKGFRCWFLNHRKEIIDQSISTLVNAVEGLSSHLGLIQADSPTKLTAALQICSIQTLVRRYTKLPRPHLIVWDECHHLGAASWKNLQKEFPDAFHIGLSATPCRTDGTGLRDCFDEMVIGPSVATLIERGFLSKYTLFSPSSPDLSGIHTVAGDYDKKELAEVMGKTQVMGDALEHYKTHIPGKRAISFLWSIESSEELVVRFRDAGFSAAHFDGETSRADRKKIVDDFRCGQIKLLSNVDIVSEGFDLPAIEAGFLLRPTQSLGLYLQQVGRILRPLPGVPRKFIFDHVRHWKKHGFPDDDRVWTLDGKPRKKKKEEEEILSRECPQCHCIVPTRVRECPECGLPFVMERSLTVNNDAKLIEVDVEKVRRRQAAEQARAQSLEDLIKVGQRRGHRFPRQWAQHVLRAREEKELRRATQAALQKNLIPPTEEPPINLTWDF